jgi:hypothetical protein
MKRTPDNRRQDWARKRRSNQHKDRPHEQRPTWPEKQASTTAYLQKNQVLSCFFE